MKPISREWAVMNREAMQSWRPQRHQGPLNRDFPHAPSLAAPAMSSSLGAIFFIITLGLQQTAFYVHTRHRGALLICKMDSKKQGNSIKMCFVSYLA